MLDLAKVHQNPSIREQSNLKLITVVNVNDALCEGISLLRHTGLRMDSRNGPVIVAQSPVVTTYLKPTERVLFSPMRDCNPFFHLMEALWMLNGGQDVAWPCYFNKNFSQFSDDGKVFHGAYGYRWRKWFGYDQLNTIIAHLQKDSMSRRSVLQMWDAERDPAKADAGGKDVPCNTTAYFDCLDDRLNMTVCCRSNDIMWGAYGANAVHFSVLMEYVATSIGKPVGYYRQFSNNYHLYPAAFGMDKLALIAADAHESNHYGAAVKPFPLMQTPKVAWDADLKCFLSSTLEYTYNDPFFNGVAMPMYRAWHQRKTKQGDGMEYVRQIAASDWRLACEQWVERRANAPKQAILS